MKEIEEKKTQSNDLITNFSDVVTAKCLYLIISKMQLISTKIISSTSFQYAFG